MYERQYGLRENPFSAGHQSKYVYPSREHQEALAHLRFGIENREAFVLITGEVGTGKTTALYDALTEWKSRAVVALITNTALTRSELYEEICMRFGVPIAGPTSKPQLIQQLERHLMVVRARGDFAILLIDEAQNLDSGLLEETRLLSNLEAQGQKLLQIFLVGQPELEEKLAQPALRQLRQRIAVHYRLRPLSREETERYIHHRISVAGGHAATLFPADACAIVYDVTHGIPREINTVAAQALLNAFVEDAPNVRPEHVRAIVEDTGFQSVLDTPNPRVATPPSPSTPPSPVVPPATAVSPPGTPAADSPVPVSPPHDAPAPTREVRKAPVPASKPKRSPGPTAPSSIDAEGQPMAGVRPAGSTESWQSWMDSLQKMPVEPDAETPPAEEAEANPAEAPAEAGAEPQEMSAEEFYAAEEAAMQAPIGDDVEAEEYEEGDEQGDDEASEYDDESAGESGEEYDDEDEYAEEGDDEEGHDEEGEEEHVYEIDEEAGETEESEITAEAVMEEISAESRGPERVEAGDDVEWLDELTGEEATPVADEEASSPAMANAADFESGPGIQWGDASSRAEEESETPEVAPAALSSRADETMPDLPEHAAEESSPSPAPPAEPAPVAAAPRREPLVARVSAAPASPMATTKAMPVRLRERLEAAERAESSGSGKLTGWLIGAAAIAAVILGVMLFVKVQKKSETPATGSEITATSSGITTADEAPAAEQSATGETTEDPGAEPTTGATNPAGSATAAAAVPPKAVVKPAPAPPHTAPAITKTEAPAGRPTVETTPNPVASSTEYGITVATFLAESRAKTELTRLSAVTGVAGRVEPTPDGDYRVVLGTYPDKNAAETAAGELIAGGKVDEARVVALAGSTKK